MVSFKYASMAVLATAAAVSASPAPEAQADVSLDERTFSFFWDLKSWKSDYNCKAPWKPHSKPSWCVGKDVPGLPKWDGGDFKLCNSIFFSWKPFCKNGNTPKPPPSGCNPSQPEGPECKNKYEVLFKDYTRVADSGVYQGKTVGAATIDNENYLTYGLATSVEGCLQVCDQTQGCVFVNVYQDNAEKPEDIAELPASAQEKFKPGTLTCALYKACSGTEKATNYGGQQDPTFITQSSGYCKSGKC